MLNTNPLDSLSYFSKTFSVITEWDGGGTFVVNVWDERKRVVVEMERVQLEHGELFMRDTREVHNVVDKLRTKYILDYDNKLSTPGG